MWNWTKVPPKPACASAVQTSKATRHCTLFMIIESALLDSTKLAAKQAVAHDHFVRVLAGNRLPPELPARAFHNQPARRNVPNLDASFEIRVKSPRRHVGHRQCRRTHLPHFSHPSNQPVEVGQGA